MFEKIYILIFLLFYFLAVFVIPSIRVKRKTGINPYLFKNTDSAHDYLGKVTAPISSIIFLAALINLFSPSILEYFAPFKWLAISFLKNMGLILIHLSLFWLITAQLQMNDSWRIGIDHSAKTVLKTKGLFSISRNPVFFGMAIFLIGFFFIIPNALTLLVFVVSFLLFQVQIRLEEEYLTKIHDNKYLVYCANVNRWI